MSHLHDDHTHITLADLHECIARQRQHLHAQMLAVLLASLTVLFVWLVLP